VRNLLLSIRRTRSNIVVYNNSVSIDVLFLVLCLLIFRYSFFMDDRELMIIWYLNKKHASVPRALYFLEPMLFERGLGTSPGGR